MSCSGLLCGGWWCVRRAGGRERGAIVSLDPASPHFRCSHVETQRIGKRISRTVLIRSLSPAMWPRNVANSRANVAARRTSAFRANSEQAVAGSARDPFGGVALLAEPALQRVRAEVLLHHQHRGAVVAEPTEPVRAAGRAGPPCRCGSAGSTRSGRSARRRAPRRGRRRSTFVRSLRVTLAAVRSRARSFTSTAHTVAPGDRFAGRARPRPSHTPGRGTCRAVVIAGASRSSSAVPVSRWPWLNTPRSVSIVNATSGERDVDDLGGRTRVRPLVEVVGHRSFRIVSQNALAASAR